jgi:hypothetical protein
MSIKSHDRVLDIMRQVENDSLLPKKFGGGTISHKTSTINTHIWQMLAWWIRPRDGVMWLQCWWNSPRDDDRANLLIQVNF